MRKNVAEYRVLSGEDVGPHLRRFSFIEGAAAGQVPRRRHHRQQRRRPSSQHSQLKCPRLVSVSVQEAMKTPYYTVSAL